MALDVVLAARHARAVGDHHPVLGAAEEVHDLGGVAGLVQGIRIQKAVGHERAE